VGARAHPERVSLRLWAGGCEDTTLFCPFAGLPGGYPARMTQVGLPTGILVHIHVGVAWLGLWQRGSQRLLPDLGIVFAQSSGLFRLSQQGT
jgi:hypothetical protein